MEAVSTVAPVTIDRLLEEKLKYYGMCGTQSFCLSLRDDEEKKKSPSEGSDEKANGTHPKTISRIGSTTNPFLDIPHDPNASVYKSGFLARKIHADMDGKKSKHRFSHSLFISSLYSKFEVKLSDIKSGLEETGLLHGENHCWSLIKALSLNQNSVLALSLL